MQVVFCFRSMLSSYVAWPIQNDWCSSVCDILQRHPTEKVYPLWNECWYSFRLIEKAYVFLGVELINKGGRFFVFLDPSFFGKEGSFFIHVTDSILYGQFHIIPCHICIYLYRLRSWEGNRSIATSLRSLAQPYKIDISEMTTLQGHQE